MRKPFLKESSSFVVEPKTDSISDTIEDLNNKTFLVSENFDVRSLQKEGFEAQDKWVLEPKKEGDKLKIQIECFPVGKDELPEPIKRQILPEEDNYNTRSVDDKTPKVLNPVIYGDFLVQLIENAGFKINSVDDSRIARCSEIGDIVMKNGNIKFGDDFNFHLFNDRMVNSLTEQADGLIDSLENPYDNLFSLQSLLPFFAKHGESATEFWSMYKNKLFTSNPLVNNGDPLNQVIDSERERFEKFVLWYDLVSNIKFELVDLTRDGIRELYKRRISNSVSEDYSNVLIPWSKQEYDWASDNILTKYEKSDFNYDRSCLTENTLVKISRNDINYVFRVLKYGRCDDLEGVLIPNGWLVEMVGTTPKETDSEVSREELYRSLKTSNCCRYLTKEEIESCDICTEDAVKPVIRTGDPYSEVYKELEKKEQYEKRIRNSIQDGYKMKRVDLLDLIEGDNLKFGYEGWHTGTICPEFPIEVSIDEGQNYSKYKEFEQDGVVSYKSQYKVRIKPDWDEIMSRTDVNSRKELLDSDYCENSRLVLVVHNLP